MDFTQEIKSQYHASLDMLQQAVEGCPPELWQRAEDKNQYWQVTYHALFYTHLYLHTTNEEFIPWPQHREEAVRFNAGEDGKVVEPFTQAEVLAYIEYLRARIGELVDAVDLEGPSGFYWLPINKLELQFYNIRHLMLHIGELAERLWVEAGVEVGWVSRLKD